MTTKSGVSLQSRCGQRVMRGVFYREVGWLHRRVVHRIVFIDPEAPWTTVAGSRSEMSRDYGSHILAVLLHAAMFETQRNGAEALHGIHVVADEEHGPASGRDLAHSPERFLLELRIADGKNFIDNRISGSRCAATANASRTYMPDE